MLKSYPMHCFCKSLRCAKPFSTYHCGRPGRFQENKDGISSGSFHLSRVTLETNREIKTGDYSASVAGDASKPLGRLMKKMCSARSLLFSLQKEGGRCWYSAYLCAVTIFGLLYCSLLKYNFTMSKDETVQRSRDHHDGWCFKDDS
jgi:hypothetical protein